MLLMDEYTHEVIVDNIQVKYKQQFQNSLCISKRRMG